MKRPLQLVCDFDPAGDQPQAIKELVDGLQQGEMFQTLLGATGSGKTFTIANVIQAVQRPTIIMAPNKTLAAQLYAEMKRFFPHNAVEYFVSYYDYYQPEAYVPSSDTFIEKDASINDHIDQMRLSATKAILQREDVIIVATVSAIYGLGDPQSYHSMILHLSIGDIVDQRAILLRLSELQYERNDVELRRATFRVRGDVIDVFPAESERDAIRIELFGEEIERLSRFDPLTGEIRQKLQRLTIFPKSHYVTSKVKIIQAIDAIRNELKTRLIELRADNKLLEAQRLEQRTLYDLEMMQELGYCTGIENYSRFLANTAAGAPPPTLINYLPDNAVMVLDESHVMVPQLGGMYRGDRSRKETLVNYGFRLPSAMDNRPLKFEEFLRLMPQAIFVSATPGNFEIQQNPHTIDQVVRPTGLVDPQIEVRPVATQVDDILSEIHQRAKKEERVLITTLTKRMSEDLTDYLQDHGIKVRYLHSDIDTIERVEIIRDLRAGKFDVLVGINLLREGLDIPEVSLVAIFDADKEGFLRSTRSLIQTIGRAARNINGKAILYADVMTGSIQKAIQETDRRRNKQIAHNTRHGIIAQSIHRKVYDIIGGVSQSPTSKRGSKRRIQRITTNIDSSDPQTLSKLLRKYEKEMYVYAENLEFEEAARVRDRIEDLRTDYFK